MKRLYSAAATAFALVGAAPVASAATQIGDHLSLSGFGTAGAVRTNSDEGTFGRDRQVGGADRDASFDVDSNLGLQATAKATPWLSATVQMLAAKRDKGHIEPGIEWAFVSVKPVEGLSLRGGRMAAPVFAISDSRNVGYANTWVRAPNEVYALNLFRNMVGGDVSYRAALGPVALSATGFTGKTKFKAIAGADATGEHLKGLSLQLESDWVTLRWGQLTTTVMIPSIFGSTGDPYKFSGVGLSVDRDNIVAQAEVVKRTSERQPVAVNADSWYVLGGYRFGAVLPYAILSGTKPKTAGSPLYMSAEQKTKALGVRWDAFSSADIKFQLDRIDTNNTKGISFTTPATPPPNPRAPAGTKPVTKTVTALSLAVDYTF